MLLGEFLKAAFGEQTRILYNYNVYWWFDSKITRQISSLSGSILYSSQSSTCHGDLMDGLFRLFVKKSIKVVFALFLGNSWCIRISIHVLTCISCHSWYSFCWCVLKLKQVNIFSGQCFLPIQISRWYIDISMVFIKAA